MAESFFIPVSYATGLLPISREQLEMWRARQPTGHREPPSPEEVAAFEAWRAAFEPLLNQGVDRGWLWVDDFEIHEPAGAWIPDEPAGDLPETITIPRGRPLSGR